MRNELGRFSDFVADLHGRAREADVETLIDWSVGALADIVGFDSAWYGWAEISAEGVAIHASATRDLPEGYYDFWTGVAEEDLLAAQILADPERVAVYDRAGEAHTDGMRALADAYGIRRMATALRLREGRSASLFLSAYRGGAARAWSRSEREFLRCAVDQISHAAQAARRWGEAPDDDAATLLVGRDGVAILGLDRARRRFGDLWSKSAGDRLPRPLSDYVDAPGEHLLIDSGLVAICETAGAADGLALRKLTLRPMRKFDLLTPRERQVARRLAEGESHKETARALGVSPSTIRNQTRSIYDKLGVENRASLAQAVPPAA